MCQGLPYWASGRDALLSPCNNYEIYCAEFEDPQAWNYYVDYTDCEGVKRRQQVGIGAPFPPRTVNICSNTTPIPGSNRPFGSPNIDVTLIGACSDGLPVIPCGPSQINRGPFPYNDLPFPESTDIGVSSSLGTVTFTSIYDVQIKKMIGTNALGQIVVDTGYFVSNGAIGNQQQILNNYLASRGLPSEPISILPLSTAMTRTFNKTSSYTTINVKTYMVTNPNYSFGEVSYWYRVSCPA